MLARLRLDGFVRGDHQEQHIDARRARQHVAHEPFVPRHIHKTEAHAIFFQECKTQIDRDSAALLFGQTIRVRSGQRFDQRRFAVVDVPGGANNYALRRNRHE